MECHVIHTLWFDRQLLEMLRGEVYLVVKEFELGLVGHEQAKKQPTKVISQPMLLKDEGPMKVNGPQHTWAKKETLM